MKHKLKRLKQIAANFLFNINRSDILKLLPKNSIGVELGVFRGQFSKQIIEIVQPEKLYLIDVWWEAFGDKYPDWGSYTNHGELTTKKAYNEVELAVSEHNYQEKTSILVGDDLLYLKDFNDGYLDWAYIDSSHEEKHTFEELKILNKKVKKKGVIMGHDWRPSRSHRHHGVFIAVQDFCHEYGWKVIKTDSHLQWMISRLDT